VGSLSISAFPLFSGFVSKSLILTAVAAEHYWGVWLVLLFASAGVLDHSGIKIPFFTFFAHDSGKRCPEAPANMLWAMGLTAFFCISLGIYPDPLYAILPYVVDFTPYTTTHVITQLQLLLFSAMAFAILFRRGVYPPEIPSINLDFDWIYRRLAPQAVHRAGASLSRLDSGVYSAVLRSVDRLAAGLFRHHGPLGVLARTWPTGSMVLWVAVLLGCFLIFYYM
jgi:multicomponent Na+:H+ antiporter subunit D